MQSHPAYRYDTSVLNFIEILMYFLCRHDSVITPEIAHDLMVRCSQIGDGRISCPEVLGDVVIERYIRISFLMCCVSRAHRLWMYICCVVYRPMGRMGSD